MPDSLPFFESIVLACRLLTPIPLGHYSFKQLKHEINNQQMHHLPADAIQRLCFKCAKRNKKH